MMAQNAAKAPVVTWARHRIACDGEGITTLVCFYGCPLQCRYCINPFTHAEGTKYSNMTPQELYEQVRQDELYFLATGGGVTFGGGEPLLYPEFISQFRQLCGDGWHLCAETSLHVPWEHVRQAAACVDVFYVDCKDTNPDIYRSYTGSDNRLMLENLQKLVQLIPPERIILRLPLIRGYNTEEDRQRSKAMLENMGIVHFDLFEYVLPQM